jgi:hypothetical protein
LRVPRSSSALQSFEENVVAGGRIAYIRSAALSFNRPPTTSNSTTSSITQFNPSSATANNMASEGEHYQPKDAVKAAITGTLVTGTAGALVAAVENSLSKRNVGAWGVLTKSGGTIGTFGMLNLRVALCAA